jgi:uncharacterized membrane protein (UPF0182 family)
MGRYDDDIPEIFRRAMEEAGWRGREPEQEDERPPRRPLSFPPWWKSRWLWLILLTLLFLASFSWLVTTYTEWLWFGNLGYRSVWWTRFSAGLVSFTVFFLLAAVVLLVNWLLARRMALDNAPLGQPLLRGRASRWLIIVAGLFFSYLLGTAAGSRADQFLRFVYQEPFSRFDPVFHRELSFYIFSLPVYRFLYGWLLPLLVLTLIGVIAIYVLNSLPTFQGGRIQVRALPLALRQHVAVLGTVMLLVWAFGYWLGIYGLLYSTRSVIFGAGYTDLHAGLLGLRVQLVFTLVLAAAVAYTVFRSDLRPALIAGGLWLAVTLLLGNLYPTLQQRYIVEPNELALEETYIEHNIAFTRDGFGLSNVEPRPFSPIEDLSAADLVQNSVALGNIRLWDYRPLLQTYAQLQELRPYYEFHDVDIDRYEIEGQMQQVMLSARELEGLAEPTWVNERLEFTHGFGVVMNPVDEVTSEGRPDFYIQDLPPQSLYEELQVTRPEVYYGELTDEIVYVSSGLEEFNFPQGSENVYRSYTGEGGVQVSNFLRRLAFAYRFGDVNLIFSQYITPETRVQFHREISERIRQIAPFLLLDHDPYLVIADGRLFWMVDAYTASRNFPYSQPSSLATETIPAAINYIRNSVKVVVDAYQGTVDFYLADPDDPIIQTYAAIYPELLKPLAEMPEALQRHIRFPEGLFLMQTHQYLTYHVQDVQVFYNREDLWQFPEEIFDGAQQVMQPYYVTFPLPGEEDAEYLLIQPYTPAGRTNMISWLAARNDPPHYGEIVAYELPKQELVFGPIQIEGLIDQDPEISQQFSLWDQLGSRVIRGNLIVVPINNSFLYVEPIYLLSETNALPELQRIIVASGNRIAMEQTLDEALSVLLQQEFVRSVDETVEGIEEGTVTLPDGLPTSVEELIRSAGNHFRAAQQAQQAGDWALYGEELQALSDDLNDLLELADEAQGEGSPSQEPAATPTPQP